MRHCHVRARSRTVHYRSARHSPDASCGASSTECPRVEHCHPDRRSRTRATRMVCRPAAEGALRRRADPCRMQGVHVVDVQIANRCRGLLGSSSSKRVKCSSTGPQRARWGDRKKVFDDEALPARADHRVEIPRFRGHPDWREYALGEAHGETETKEVHGRVQGRCREALRDGRSFHRAGGGRP